MNYRYWQFASMKDGIACRLFKSLQALSLLPCLWLFLFFCSATALSNADAIQALIVETSIKPVFIHESDQRIDLKPFMLVFHDPDNSLTWNDVLADDSDVHWMHVSELDAVKHIGGRHWFKVNLKVDETTRQRHSELILHFPYQAILMQEMVLQINGDGNLLRSGLYVDKKARAINHSVNSLPIVLDTENVQLLGYVQNNYLRIPAHFEFQLSSQKDYLQQFQQGQYLYVAFYAIMAALLIYNLCLFLTIRQPLYGVYCLFIISTAISCALNDGNALLWLWPGQFAFNTLMSYATSFIPPMLFLSFVYLATEKSSFWPGFRFVYLGLNVSGFLLLGGLLWLPQSGGGWILLVVDIYPAIILATIFTLIIAAVYQRQALSQYLMLAEIVLLAGGVNYALANQGIIALTELSNWSLHAGVVAEALLLAITLAARTRDMQLKALEQQALAYQYQSDALVIQENADRLKTEFMSTITHELLTPINGITLSHNLLQDAVGEEKHRLLASAKTSTTQLLHLVESMLVFSEARIEQLVLHPEPVDLTAYLNELLQQYLDCSHSYAKLELHYDRSQPYWILVDRKKLDILLHQLIKNAMQNTVQGKVVISCVVTTVNESEVLLSLSINNQGLS
ncbi:MAG: sensor histidine kinase, partial [Pseudomonadales bacterium]|nr:sensor histidine kinase [Pseudomonadales bacterium]